MEDKVIFIPSSSRRFSLRAERGHFATNHSHVNYYLDMTDIKSNQRVAEEVAEVLARQYTASTEVDTIVCLDGTEIIGAFLAQELAKGGSRGLNQGETIYVLTPELNALGQMMFRDNVRPVIKDKNIILLMASVTTGVTVQKGAECISYYGGNLRGASAIFSARNRIDDVEVHSLFHVNDLPGYESRSSGQCSMCSRGEKLDAIINGFGYFKV